MQLEKEKDSVSGDREEENQTPPHFHYNDNCLPDNFFISTEHTLHFKPLLQSRISLLKERPMAGNKDLHELRPGFVVQPLHNSIPPDLLPRFDPVYVEYYNKYNAGRLHTHEVPIEVFRKDPAKYLTAYGRAAGPDVFSITEKTCAVKDGEIRIRIFEPAPAHDEQGRPKKRAVYINFHGGGWVFGNLSTDHDFCKRLVNGLDGHLVVFDVDYRLAPEYRFPTAVDDCWAAFNWVRSLPLLVHCPFI